MTSFFSRSETSCSSSFKRYFCSLGNLEKNTLLEIDLFGAEGSISCLANFCPKALDNNESNNMILLFRSGKLRSDNYFMWTYISELNPLTATTKAASRYPKRVCESLDSMNKDLSVF